MRAPLLVGGRALTAQGKAAFAGAVSKASPRESAWRNRHERRDSGGYMERNRGDLRPFAWWFGFVARYSVQKGSDSP